MKKILIILTFLVILFSNSLLAQDSTSIKALILKAGEGDPESQYLIGNAYFIGSRVPKSQEKALVNIKASAENNYPPAQALLGLLYLNGTIVKENHKKAIKYFRYASAQKNLLGQTGLAIMYGRGLETKAQPKLAIELFKNAAEGGHYLAQYHLATHYELGYGVNKNIDRAHQWLIICRFMMGVTSIFLTAHGKDIYKDASARLTVYEKNMSPAHVRISRAAAMRWIDNNSTKTQGK